MSADPSDDPRIMDAAREYLAEREAGMKPDRAVYKRRYPDLAAALDEYFDGIDLAQALRPPAPLATAVDEQAGGPAAQPIGDFSLVREVGRGGMGVVYEALQMSLGRRVALKVLPFAAALDARALQRFKNEAQAAAHLHHPNIVPVYGVGCDRGVHYYAMQLIEGRSLADVIDELQEQLPLADSLGSEGSARSANSGGKSGRHDAPTSPNARHSTRRSDRGARDRFRSAAALIKDAASALDYAHGMGIVHRDIKPGNLMIDGRGAVWITDFGLAMFQNEANLTRTGDMVGTLRYMAPEQASGKKGVIDHRADVYALGATLYELLTLRPMFNAGDRQALLREILHGEPDAPRKADKRLPPALETVILKATAKLPTERYATAGEFADDLGRFLDDRPVLARRPSVPERLGKWARRHSGLVATGAVALAFCSTALGVAAVKSSRAYDKEAEQRKLADAGRTEAETQRNEAQTQRNIAVEERGKAEEQRLIAVTERQRAEDYAKKARLAVDGFADLGIESKERGPAADAIRKRIIERAVAYYQDFLKDAASDPKLRGELLARKTKFDAAVAEYTTLLGSKRLTILDMPPVWDQLKLDEAQKEQARRIQADFPDPKASGSGTPPAPEFVLGRARRHERFVEGLRDAQRRRFNELALQFDFAPAFRDPEIHKKFGLSDDQKKSILLVLEQMPQESGGGPKGGGEQPKDGPPPKDGGFDEEAADFFKNGPKKGFDDGSPDEFDGPKKGPKGQFGKKGPKKGPEDESGGPEGKGGAKGKGGMPNAQVLQRILALLTADQLLIWKEMTGQPYSFGKGGNGPEAYNYPEGVPEGGPPPRKLD